MEAMFECFRLIYRKVNTSKEDADRVRNFKSGDVLEDCKGVTRESIKEEKEKRDKEVRKLFDGKLIEMKINQFEVVTPEDMKH